VEIFGVDVILELYSDFMRVKVTFSLLSVLFLLFFAVFHCLVLHKVVLVSELEIVLIVVPIYAVRILEMYLHIVILKRFVVKRFVAPQ